jgi:hypothetical protein
MAGASTCIATHFLRRDNRRVVGGVQHGGQGDRVALQALRRPWTDEALQVHPFEF